MKARVAHKKSENHKILIIFCSQPPLKQARKQRTKKERERFNEKLLTSDEGKKKVSFTAL
jgi:hypothetical protein